MHISKRSPKKKNVTAIDRKFCFFLDLSLRRLFTTSVSIFFVSMECSQTPEYTHARFYRAKSDFCSSICTQFISENVGQRKGTSETEADPNEKRIQYICMDFSVCTNISVSCECPSLRACICAAINIAMSISWWIVAWNFTCPYDVCSRSSDSNIFEYRLSFSRAFVNSPFLHTACHFSKDPDILFGIYLGKDCTKLTMKITPHVFIPASRDLNETAKTRPSNHSSYP